VAVLVVGAHLEGVVALGQVAELRRRGAGREVAAVEPALELRVGPRRPEGEARAPRSDERGRRLLDLRLGGVDVRVALGRADDQAPAEQRAGVVLVPVAHPELPGALLLLAVEARQLVALRA